MPLSSVILFLALSLVSVIPAYANNSGDSNLPEIYISTSTYAEKCERFF